MASTSDGSGKLKKSESTQDLLDAALDRRRTSKTTSKSENESKAAPSKFTNIESNTFYKVVFSEGDPEENKDQIAKLLAYDL